MVKTVCTAVCGDGVFIAEKEECDDENQKNGDGCSMACALEDGYSCSQSGKETTKCKEIVASADDLTATMALNPPTYSWVKSNRASFRAAFIEDMAYNLGLPLSLMAVKSLEADGEAKVLVCRMHVSLFPLIALLHTRAFVLTSAIHCWTRYFGRGSLALPHVLVLQNPSVLHAKWFGSPAWVFH
jgi:cysteine-rich repeat protein